MTTASKPLSVLVTDDIPDNRKWIIDIILAIAPHASIQEAENGSIAVRAVKDKILNDSKSFDLIILDYKMPVLNGEKATIGIREMENNAQNINSSVIITWSTSKSSPYPQADNWLPKLTSPGELEQMMRDFNLI